MKPKIKEDASSGASGASSVAAGPAQNLFNTPQKRVKETASVTDYNPKSGNRKELIAKYAKSGSGADAAAAGKAGATEKELKAAREAARATTESVKRCSAISEGINLAELDNGPKGRMKSGINYDKKHVGPTVDMDQVRTRIATDKEQRAANTKSAQRARQTAERREQKIDTWNLGSDEIERLCNQTSMGLGGHIADIISQHQTWVTVNGVSVAAVEMQVYVGYNPADLGYAADDDSAEEGLSDAIDVLIYRDPRNPTRLKARVG